MGKKKKKTKAKTRNDWAKFGQILDTEGAKAVV
jgi:hypothetical protein